MSYDNIPQEMRAFKNWVCFKLEPRGKDGKLSKVPYNPLTGHMAKSNDPNTWVAFNDVIDFMDRFDGIGFQFTNSPFVGVDIDHCIENGTMTAQAMEIVQTLNSYTEYSPSGTGLHIICKGNLPEGGNRNGPYEMYSNGRYFTVTGKALQGYTAINERTGELKQVHSKYIGQAKKTAQNNHNGEKTQPQGNSFTVDMVTQDIIKAINKSKQADKFNQLMQGNISGYPSQSEAEQAFCNILAFFTGKEIAKIDEIFRQSALYRPKWDEVHDGTNTYGTMTMNKAINDCHGVYDPNYHKKQRIEKIKSEIHKTDEELLKLAYFPYTDAGNAERLIYLYGDTLKYCIDYDKWFVYDGKIWGENNDIITYPLMIHTMRTTRQMVEEVYKDVDPRDEDAQKEKESKIRFCLNSENIGKIIGALRVAKSLCNVKADVFDVDKWLLNCQNGVLDLRNGRLMSHDKNFMLSKICKAEYQPYKPNSLWEQTVNQILPDEELREYMHKFMGYCLTGSTCEEKFCVLYGAGGGGKGTFIETIGNMLGDYKKTISIDVLLSAKNNFSNGNEPTPEIAKLPGARLVLSSESGKGRKFNDAKLKSLTGSDILPARQLRCPPFEFIPDFKMILSSNFLPAITETTDEGIRRRLIIVPFANKEIKENKDVTLKERLSNRENLNDVLAWCVEGCLKWQREGIGCLNNLPLAIQKMNDDFYQDNDLIGMWIDEMCEVGDNHKGKLSELLSAYNYWTDRGNTHFNKMSRKGFSDSLISRGFKKHKLNNGQHFTGIKLKNGCI